jgi:hypothetical protein
MLDGEDNDRNATVVVAVESESSEPFLQELAELNSTNSAGTVANNRHSILQIEGRGRG